MTPDVLLRYFNRTRLSLLLDDSLMNVLETLSVSRQDLTIEVLGRAFSHIEKHHKRVDRVYLPAGLHIRGMGSCVDMTCEPPMLWGAPLVFVKGLRRIVVQSGGLLDDFEPNHDPYHVVVELE